MMMIVIVIMIMIMRMIVIVLMLVPGFFPAQQRCDLHRSNSKVSARHEITAHMFYRFSVAGFAAAVPRVSSVPG